MNAIAHTHGTGRRRPPPKGDGALGAAAIEIHAGPVGYCGGGGGGEVLFSSAAHFSLPPLQPPPIYTCSASVGGADGSRQSGETGRNGAGGAQYDEAIATEPGWITQFAISVARLSRASTARPGSARLGAAARCGLAADRPSRTYSNRTERFGALPRRAGLFLRAHRRRGRPRGGGGGRERGLGSYCTVHLPLCTESDRPCRHNGRARVCGLVAVAPSAAMHFIAKRTWRLARRRWQRPRRRPRARFQEIGGTEVALCALCEMHAAAISTDQPSGHFHYAAARLNTTRLLIGPNLESLTVTAAMAAPRVGAHEDGSGIQANRSGRRHNVQVHSHEHPRQVKS